MQAREIKSIIFLSAVLWGMLCTSQSYTRLHVVQNPLICYLCSPPNILYLLTTLRCGADRVELYKYALGNVKLAIL
jgi:hypothetical protein